jgi:hypothetical protein
MPKGGEERKTAQKVTKLLRALSLDLAWRRENAARRVIGELKLLVGEGPAEVYVEMVVNTLAQSPAHHDLRAWMKSVSLH